MSCGKRELIENYGDPHLHHGASPFAPHEAAAQECPGACYFGDQWPQVQRQVAALDDSNTLQVVNQSNDPSKRYGYSSSGDATKYEIGTGCMNTRCMCPNCHGDCKCPKNPDYSQLEPNLFETQKVIEPFGARLEVGFKLEEGTIFYLLAALLLFLAWYMLDKRGFNLFK